MSNQVRKVRTSEGLASAARFAAVLADMGLGTLDDLLDAVARVQADLAAGRMMVEDFVKGAAAGGSMRTSLKPQRKKSRSSGRTMVARLRMVTS